MVELFLYSKENCHLCEEMHADLLKIINGTDATCHLIDITGDHELEHRYGARLPVLTVGPDEICELKLDQTRLEAYLSSKI